MIQNNDNSTPRNDNGQYCYRYPHPALTADCVIFGFDGERLRILLIERGLEPYLGMWALPGGFMKIDETIEQAAARELMEETGLENVFLDQFRVYSDPGRDPRERVVTVAFIALVRQEEVRPVGGDDARRALWFDANALPPLAFDHAKIIAQAREHLSEVLRIKPVAFTLLNEMFTISELQKVYEAINGTRYDRRNFQRKLLQSDIVEEKGIAKTSSPSRPPKLFSLKDRIRNMLESIVGEASEEPDYSVSRPAPMESEKSRTDLSVSRKMRLSDSDNEDIIFPKESDDNAADDEKTPPPSTRDLFNF